MAEPTIAAGYARALMEFAVSMGADRESLIARSQIDPDDLRDPDNRVPIGKYIALLNAGADLCNEPALSLLFGEKVRGAELSIVALIARFAETPDEALEQINRFSRLRKAQSTPAAVQRPPTTPGHPNFPVPKSEDRNAPNPEPTMQTQSDSHPRPPESNFAQPTAIQTSQSAP